MTAPDPRLDQIAYRAQILLRCVEEAPNDSYGIDDLPTAIHEQRHDVAYLLAELRKAREALERVEELADELATQSDGRGLDYSDDDFDRGWHGANRAAVDQLRAAVAAAKETE